jgi:hypothetical protein
MLSISRKQLVVLVSALAIFPFNAGLSNANPVDTKEKKPDSKGKAVESKSKPGSSTSKPANSKSADAIVGDGNSGSNGNGNASGNGSSDSKDRHRAGKHGKHRGRDKQGGPQRRDDIPSFRNVKRLESLTPVQEAKITHIIRLQREQLLPLAERLREIREASKNAANGASGKPNKSPEIVELRRKIHAIKKDAWLKMQGILTARQKIELEGHHDDESGPPRRNNPDARPSVHDSGKSFSQ